AFFSFLFFFSSRRRHTRSKRDWSSDVCSSDLAPAAAGAAAPSRARGRRTPTKVRFVRAHGSSSVFPAQQSPLQPAGAGEQQHDRSEERRVGKESRDRRTWSE